MFKKAQRLNANSFKVIFTLELNELLFPVHFLKNPSFWNFKSHDVNDNPAVAFSICFAKGGKVATTQDILIYKNQVFATPLPSTFDSSSSSKYDYEMIRIPIDQNVSLPITMYQDKKTRHFHEKNSSIILRRSVELISDYQTVQYKHNHKQTIIIGDKNSSITASHEGIGRYQLPLHEILYSLDYQAISDEKDMKIVFDLQNGIGLTFMIKTYLPHLDAMKAGGQPFDEDDNCSVISDLTTTSAIGGVSFSQSPSSQARVIPPVPNPPPSVNPVALPLNEGPLPRTSKDPVTMLPKSPWKSPKRLTSWPGIEVVSPSDPEPTTQKAASSPINPTVLHSVEEKQAGQLPGILPGLFPELQQHTNQSAPISSQSTDIPSHPSNAQDTPTSQNNNPNPSLGTSGEKIQQILSNSRQEIQILQEKNKFLTEELESIRIKSTQEKSQLLQEIHSLKQQLINEQYARELLSDITLKTDKELAKSLAISQEELSIAQQSIEQMQVERQILQEEIRYYQQYVLSIKNSLQEEKEALLTATEAVVDAKYQNFLLTEENETILNELIELKVNYVNQLMEMELLQQKNSQFKKTIAIYAEKMTKLEVKYHLPPATAINRLSSRSQSSKSPNSNSSPLPVANSNNNNDVLPPLHCPNNLEEEKEDEMDAIAVPKRSLTPAGTPKKSSSVSKPVVAAAGVSPFSPKTRPSSLTSLPSPSLLGGSSSRKGRPAAAAGSPSFSLFSSSPLDYPGPPLSMGNSPSQSALSSLVGMMSNFSLPSPEHTVFGTAPTTDHGNNYN